MRTGVPVTGKNNNAYGIRSGCGLDTVMTMAARPRGITRAELIKTAKKTNQTSIGRIYKVLKWGAREPGYRGFRWTVDENESRIKIGKPSPIRSAVGLSSMNVSLPEKLKKYVETQTKYGYSTPSEYVRELIREDQRRKAKEKLDTLLLEGLNSGDPGPVDAKFWADLKQEALAKLTRKKHSAKR